MIGKEWVESLTLKEQHDKMEEFMNKPNLTADEQAQFSALLYMYLRRVHQAGEITHTRTMVFG